MRLLAEQVWGRHKPLAARDGMSRISLPVSLLLTELKKLALHALKVCRLDYNTLSHSRQPTVQSNDVYLPPLLTEAH